MSDKDDIREELAKCELFKSLGRKGMKVLTECSKRTEHPAGKEVIEQGGQPFGFHLISEGTAKVFVNGEERRTLGPGDYFGIVSLLDGEPRSATVRTESTMKSLFISPWSFRPLLKEQPEIAYEMLPALCALLRSAESQ